MFSMNGSQPPQRGDHSFEDEEEDDDDFDPQEYDSTLRLERLESLEEEMQDLGVTTLDEVRQRIAELHRELG